MNYKKLASSVLLVLVVGLNCVSCATIVNGTTQKIPVSSEPAGAYVFVDGIPAGCTPTQIQVKRKYTHLVTLSKEGFDDATVRLEPVLSAAVAGNIIAGGFIGWGVDAVNGAQYRLVPGAVNVRLNPSVCPVPFQPPFYSNNE